jgi:aminomethyltransferase
VEIIDDSDDIAAVALQGPKSRDILKQITHGADLDGLRYYRLDHGDVAGIPATISRTGYTGDLGYEIWVDAENAIALWDALIEAGAPYQITPAGILALDIARVEAGLLMIEVDYVSSRHALIEAQKSTPYELNLGWAVALDKRNFVGRSALLAENQRRPEWRFVGVHMDWPSLERAFAEVGLPPRVSATTWRTSIPLYIDGHQIGYASSGCWSPILKRNIALAHVRAEYATPGTVVDMEIMVEHQRRTASAAITKTPFFDPERKRAVIR